MFLSITKLLISVVFFSFSGQAQNILDPVSWDAVLIEESSGVYVVELTAHMEDKWVIYSQHLDEGGPIPTEFEFELSEGATLIGEVEEPKNPIVEEDEMFMMTLTKFKKEAKFVQKIESKTSLEEVKGAVTFMTCDNMRCLPPKTVEFSAKK